MTIVIVLARTCSGRAVPSRRPLVSINELYGALLKVKA